MKLIFLFFTLLVTMLLTGIQGCSSSDGDNNVMENLPDITSGELTEFSNITVPANLGQAATAILFDYTMASVTGVQTTARALLFEPVGQRPANGFPLVVWAHGTTGISNACAPSDSFENFGNSVAINALLVSGYAVLAPDYEGFGTPIIHPYYQRASHAGAVLAAVTAAHSINDVVLSDAWAVVGHSQGGHVALASARAEQNPLYPLQAVVALAPGTDIKPFSDRAFEAIDMALAEGALDIAADRSYYLNVYSAYIAHALQLIEPTFNPKSLYGETVAALIDTALDESRCGDYAESVADAMRQHIENGGTVLDFAGLKRNWYDDPAFVAQLEIEELGDEPQSSPLLIIQGDADRQVPVEATTAFVDRQRSLGTDVNYQVIAGGRHGSVAREEIARTISWLTEQFPPL